MLQIADALINGSGLRAGSARTGATGRPTSCT